MKPLIQGLARNGTDASQVVNVCGVRAHVRLGQFGRCLFRASDCLDVCLRLAESVCVCLCLYVFVCAGLCLSALLCACL